jgi:hypothetical protein
MPGSSTTPGRSDLAMVRPKRVAFRARNGVGTRGLAFAAQWLAYALPYRRFVGVLTDANARLGADVDRYSFIVVDLHHLLLAGLPAHFESSHASHAVGGRVFRKIPRIDRVHRCELLDRCAINVALEDVLKRRPRRSCVGIEWASPPTGDGSPVPLTQAQKEAPPKRG